MSATYEKNMCNERAARFAFRFEELIGPFTIVAAVFVSSVEPDHFESLRLRGYELNLPRLATF